MADWCRGSRAEELHSFNGMPVLLQPVLQKPSRQPLIQAGRAAPVEAPPKEGQDPLQQSDPWAAYLRTQPRWEGRGVAS